MNRFRRLYKDETKGRDLGSWPKVDGYKIPRGTLDGKHILVDIGGCRGEFTERYKKHFDECFIFEASFENASFINKRIIDEGWTNTAVFNLAVSDTTGDILKLYSNHNDRGSGSILGGSTHLENYTNVLSITFNDILKLLNVPKIDLLKIDCEGAEHKFVTCSNFENVDIICIELHAWEGCVDNMINVENHLLKTHHLYDQYMHAGHKIQTYKRK